MTPETSYVCQQNMSVHIMLITLSDLSVCVFVRILRRMWTWHLNIFWISLHCWIKPTRDASMSPLPTPVLVMCWNIGSWNDDLYGRNLMLLLFKMTGSTFKVFINTMVLDQLVELWTYINIYTLICYHNHVPWCEYDTSRIPCSLWCVCVCV